MNRGLSLVAFALLGNYIAVKKSQNDWLQFQSMNGEIFFVNGLQSSLKGVVEVALLNTYIAVKKCTKWLTSISIHQGRNILCECLLQSETLMFTIFP